MESNHTRNHQVCAQLLSHVRLCDPMDFKPEGFLCMESSRQEYWSRLPFPTPGDLTEPETEPKSLVSPTLAGGFFTWRSLLGLEKKITVSKSPYWIIQLRRKQNNFNSTLMLQAGCIYLGLITSCPETFHPLHLPRGFIAPCPETFHPLHAPRPEDLSPPAQLQMSSQQKNTQYIPPDWCFPYRFHKPPYKYEASLIPLSAQPGCQARLSPLLT